MRFQTLVRASLVAILLVVGGGVEVASAHPAGAGTAAVKVERRFVFKIRTVAGYVKHVVIWAPGLKVAIDRLRVHHPHAKILAVN